MNATPGIDLPLKERTVGELLAKRAGTVGDQTCLLFEDQRYSYVEVDQLTNRIANGLSALGVKQGEHVALLLENTPETLWVYLALGKLGAVAVPINTAAKGELLTTTFSHSESTFLVIDANLMERFAQIHQRCPLVRRMVVINTTGSAEIGMSESMSIPVATWESVLEGAATRPKATVRFCDPFLLMYTSGTTGPSKASVAPHGYAITYGLQRAIAFGFNSDDVLYTCLPLFHGNALLSTCFCALATGATIVLSRRFSASRFWSEIAASGATQFNLVGAMINFLWAQPCSELDRAHRVRQCTILPMPSFAAEFQERFNIQLTSLYAVSDYGLGAVLPAGHPPEKRGSAGQAAPGVEVSIVDDDDLVLPAGEVGEICLRAREPWTTSQGYWKMPEATIASRRNLWYHTGDRGYLDAEGYLYFTDRKKDAIRRRGENISSWEIEKVIQRHPAVVDVAAYAVPGISEDEVMVTIVLKPGQEIDPVELIGYCQKEMAYYMVPRYIEFADELPRGLTQKVEKYKLRDSARDRLDNVWDRERAGVRVSRDA